MNTKDNRPPRRDGQRRPGGRPGNGPKPVNHKQTISARKLALNALCDVTMAGAYSNIALDKRLHAAPISPEDRRLATNIFYTALDNRLYIDYVLSHFIDHMPDEGVVRELLHIACAQLLFMDRVPDYAVVNDAVTQIKALNRPQYVGMMNGALRNIIRARDGGELPKPDRAANVARYFSIMYSFPETIAARLMATYGEDMTEAILSYRPDSRYETIRPNIGEMDDAAFERMLTGKGWTFDRGSVAHSYHVSGVSDLAATPEYRTGQFSIQSESSMLAAYAVGAKPGMSIIDACAAPGGKTALMAELMGGSGRVYAYELHQHRVELIRRNAARLRLYNIRPVQTDATIFRPESEATADAVLIDAPCTGLGVMTGKPDLKLRLANDDVTAIAAVQKKLLDTCCRYVKPGGTLVYSTCTLLAEENIDQVREFLHAHPDFSLIDDDSWLPEKLRPHFEGGCIQLFAHRDLGQEGFFIARMRRAR